MGVVKLAAGFACGIMILLFVLVFTVKNPETALYEKTVETLMKQEGLTSERAVENCFPILRDIQSNMNRITDLKQMVSSKTQSPVPPIIAKEEALQLGYYNQRIHQLRKAVQIELSRIVAIYAKKQP